MSGICLIFLTVGLVLAWLSRDQATYKTAILIFTSHDRDADPVERAAELADDSASGVGAVRLSAVWLPTQYDTLTLMFNGTDWIEISRSAN